MKSSRFFRTLAVALMLSLLVVAVPAAPVLAAEKVTLDPDEGIIGERIDIDGEDFSSNVTVYIYFSSEKADEGDEIDDEVEIYERVKTDKVDEDGEFSTDFDVPEELTDGDKDEDVHAGTYYVYVTERGDKDILTVDKFTVLVVEITLTPNTGVVGGEVKITGKNFADREEITVEYDGREVDIESGDKKTDSDGKFTCTIITPEGTAGRHTITVTDESDHDDEADFTVEPKITVSPTSGAVGDSVSVSGKGFAASESVYITYDEEQIKKATTNSKGSFSPVSFTVPESRHGNQPVEATDDSDNSATTNFVVESTPPPSPELVSPANGSRVGFMGKVAPTFEWSVVTDPSGISHYVLLIASDEELTTEVFSQNLAEEDLTVDTESNTVSYTLSKDSAVSQGTYYWSVKAIDNAENPSGWATPAYSFHAGLLPLWAFIVIIVLIVVLIGALLYVFVIRKKKTWL